MHQKILNTLASYAFRGQFLSDNRFHNYISDDQFESLAAELSLMVEAEIASRSTLPEEPTIAHV